MSANLFDASYYSAANPDLALAGITTKEQLLAHFQNIGLSEGRAFSPVVDLNFYRSLNTDLTQAGLTTNQQLFNHLQNFGVAENRRFSPLVNLDFYLAKNQDVSQTFGKNRELALEHLQSLGIAEGRQFSPSIDLYFYAAKNPDISQAFAGDRVKTLEHLKNFGMAEKRLFSPLVNLNYYLAANPDVSSAFGSDRFQAFTHLETNGIAEQRRFSLVFDPTYYQQTNPDLATAGLNNQQLFEHFASFGLNEGRRCSENFDIRYYLENNPDLKTAGFNYQQAFQHALLYGWQEGRPSSPGHTLNEPVLVWRQQQIKSFFNYSAVADISLDKSGNIVLVQKNFTASRTASFVYVDYVAKYNSLTGNSIGKITNIQSPEPAAISAFDSIGNLYVSGILGSTFGSAVVLSKYDNSGTELWSRAPLASSYYKSIAGLSLDKAGNAYIGGGTRESLAGNNPIDNTDAWVAKYDGLIGTQQWRRQIGTSKNDEVSSIVMDNSDNIYIAGTTAGNLGGTNAGNEDVWVAKYDSLTGTPQWLQQLGSSNADSLRSMILDSTGNIYITGITTGDLGGTNVGDEDVWVAKYDSLTGTQQWLQHLGSSMKDKVDAIAFDNSGNLYVTGQTTGDLAGKNAGDYDIWLAKYDSLTGTRQWLQQFGSSNSDRSSEIDFDNAGNVYIQSRIGQDLGVAKYNSSGTQQWLLPAPNNVLFSDTTVDGAGDIYASGFSTGSGSQPQRVVSIYKYSPISTFF